MLAIDRRAGTAVDGETRKNPLVASFARNLGGESEMITTLPSRLHGNQCLFDMPRKYQKHYGQSTSLRKRGRGELPSWSIDLSKGEFFCDIFSGLSIHKRNINPYPRRLTTCTRTLSIRNSNSQLQRII